MLVPVQALQGYQPLHKTLFKGKKKWSVKMSDVKVLPLCVAFIYGTQYADMTNMQGTL